MTVMLIKATPCVKQPAFKPRESVKFDITCVFKGCSREEWTDTIVASTARNAISEYLRGWALGAGEGWIDHWETNFVVETSAWPYGEERLEEVRIIYGRD